MLGLHMCHQVFVSNEQQVTFVATISSDIGMEPRLNYMIGIILQVMIHVSVLTVVGICCDCAVIPVVVNIKVWLAS